MTPTPDYLRQRTRDHLFGTAELARQVADENVDAIVAAADLIAETFRGGGKLLMCGNGGSAADCQHLAAEFVSRLSRQFERKALPAIALTTDSSILTAIGNDYGYQVVFSRQVEALGRPGDVLLGISTSGSSPNVVEAFRMAKTIPMRTISLTGPGGCLADVADVAICVPGQNPQHVQELHLAIEHLLCDLAEQKLFFAE
jgi:phosphoheptose isomerase